MGMLWGITFIFFEQLHGMRRMFHEEFPFVVADIFNVNHESMSTTAGFLFAYIDGFVAGIVFGLISSKIFKMLYSQ